MSRPASNQRGRVVHIAGPDIKVGSLRRQRCAWCGFVLDDMDLAHIMVPEGQPGPGSWAQGALIAVEENQTWVVDVEEDADGLVPLPEDCCAKLPAELTL